MADADGTVKINIEVPIDETTASIKKIEDLLEGLGKNTGKDMDVAFGDSSDEMAQKAKDTKEKIDQTFDDPIKPKVDNTEAKAKVEDLAAEFKKMPKSQRTLLEAEAKRQGFDSFEAMAKKLPKEQVTKLLADNKDGNQKTSLFKRLLDALPKRHNTDLDATDKGSGAIKQYAMRMSDAVKGSMVFQGVTKAVTVVTNQLGDAISRFDTLNNFPKILGSMGVSAKDAQGSIKTLSEGVQGLPTALNDVASATQRFFPVLDNDIGLATKSSLALNDAFIASGASGEDASRGLQQYLQMLESGKVDQQSWLSIAQTMPKALQEVAKSFGIADGSQQKLYERIQSGQISMKDLNARFVELDGGVNGFHKQALLATGGIGTAITNMKNRITAGLTEGIKSFDEASKKMTGKTIADNVNDASSAIGNSLKKIGQSLGQLTPAFQVVGKTITGVWDLIKQFGQSLSSSFLANTDKVTKSGFAKFWSDVGKNVDGLMKSLEPVVAALGGLVGVLGGAIWKTFSGLVSGIADSFGGISKQGGASAKFITDMSQGFNALWGNIEPLIKPLGTIIGYLAQGVWETVSGFVKGVSEAFGDFSKSISGEDGKKLNGISGALQNIAKHGNAVKGVGGFLIELAAGIGAVVLVVKTLTAVQKAWNVVTAITNGLMIVFDGALLPVIAIIGGIILAVIAVVEAFKHWDDIKKWLGNLGKWFSDAWKGIKKNWDSFWSGLAKGASGIFKDIQSGFSKGWDSFTKWFSGLGKGIGKTWDSIWNPISKAFSSFWKSIQKAASVGLDVLKKIIVYPIAFIAGLFILAWQKIEKPFTKFWNDLTKTVTGWFTAIGKTLSSWGKAISKAWSSIWDPIAKFFTDLWNGFIKTVDNVLQWLNKNIVSALKVIQKFWSNTWDGIGDFFTGIWNNMIKFGQNAVNAISNAISVTIRTIQKIWSSVWGSISDFFGGIWNGMSKFFTPIIHSIDDTISNVIHNIQKTWNSVWGSVGDFFGGIWDSIKKAAETGINFVIDVIRTGLGAVNGVLGFFGVKKVDLPNHVKLARGGKVGSGDQKGEFVEVNDGGGEHWKELIQYPNGTLSMSQERHKKGWLPTGARVYSGDETHEIMSRAGIKHYADGGFIGDVLGNVWDGVKGAAAWVGDKAGDVASWIGDKWKAITDWIAHPVKHVTELINGAIKGITSSAPLRWVAEMGQGVFTNAFGGIGTWIKKMLEPVKKKHDDESIGNGPMKSLPELESLAREAAKIMHVDPDDNFIRALANVAMSESGGRAGAANNWDVNAQAGLASVGLLQYIPTTWDYYAVKGHNNRSSALDNFVTFFNNSDWKNSIGYVTYPSWGGNYKWDWKHNGPIGSPRYANGGWANRASIFGETGEPEVAINPKKASADRLILEAIAARLQSNPSSPLNLLHEKPAIFSTYRPNISQSIDGRESSAAGDDVAQGKLLADVKDLLSNVTFNLQGYFDPDSSAKVMAPYTNKHIEALKASQKLISRATYKESGVTIVDSK
ncbi:MAG: tape measure protein [Schleiferilactobacillus perolens]|uniref:tape measure protein n=1 Tax=Schleiferilactobacillus perolens TaxID=100468 RepID=UPI0039E98676